MSRITMLRTVLKPRVFIPLATRRFASQLATATATRPAEEKKLDILFFANKHNSLSQRMALELRQRQHSVNVQEISDPNTMTDLALQAQPDLILCPFLTKRIPEDIYSDSEVPCWIVHPGIEGDRGMSSVDWALYDKEHEWGVSVLEADLEMDAGDIWSTKNFPVNRKDVNTLTKSSLYVNEVTQTAVKAVLDALDNLVESRRAPRPLDYSRPHVRGTCRPNMTKTDRTINWEMAADEVANQIRMSDSSPGAVGWLRANELTADDRESTKEFRVFGAHLEKGKLRHLPGRPGEILGKRHGAVLVKCGRGAVWVSHLKRQKLKLPATMWLETNAATLPESTLPIPYGTHPDTYQDIWTSAAPNGVRFVHFNFYNGAMSTTQCRRLVSVLQQMEEDPSCKVIVLMGGHDMFSNGIHLNVIERAADPAEESWNNINAINDVVRCIFTSKKITFSALRGNAGAGGAMMALASDFAFAREGVVLNPHYKQMKLYGSEYHTYFLPERVGPEKAQELLSNAEPILATEAVEMGFLDGCMGDTVEEFEDGINELACYMARSPFQNFNLRTRKRTSGQGIVEKIEECRRDELSIMSRNFQDPEYHQARKMFVYH